jgi:hypothetical protein
MAIRGTFSAYRTQSPHGAAYGAVRGLPGDVGGSGSRKKPTVVSRGLLGGVLSGSGATWLNPRVPSLSR